MLHLDSRIALEALVLNRLERIPQARRQAWLRGLLIQGFKDECQTLQCLQDETVPRHTTPLRAQALPTHRPNSAFAAWLAQAAPRPSTATKKLLPSKEKQRSGQQGKPFAGLKKVIG